MLGLFELGLFLVLAATLALFAALVVAGVVWVANRPQRQLPTMTPPAEPTPEVHA